MKVVISKDAGKFLENLTPKDKERIKDKLKILVTAIEESGSIPFKELDIKTLKGDWKGWQRMRLGKIRVIFSVQPDELQIFEIDFRGDIYKKR
jgi:mRNA interferase RelE/StbE